MGRLGIILFFSLFRISDDPVLSIIRSDAMKIGIPETYLNEAFSHSKIEIHDSILDRFARPYEKKTWDEYRKLFVTKNRIDEGAKFFKSHGDILTGISKELKVDPFLILSIIGVESNFGRRLSRKKLFSPARFFPFPDAFSGLHAPELGVVENLRLSNSVLTCNHGYV